MGRSREKGDSEAERGITKEEVTASKVARPTAGERTMHSKKLLKSSEDDKGDEGEEEDVGNFSRPNSHLSIDRFP